MGYREWRQPACKGEQCRGEPCYKGAMHFVDGADEETEYLYDDDGNMVCDKNKGISEIT